MNKELENYILSQQMSTEDELKIGIQPSKPVSKEQMFRNWEIQSEQQKRIDKKNEIFFKKEDEKRRKWREEHWVCGEGGDGYYDHKDD